MSLKSFVIDTSINRYLFFYLLPLRKQNYHLNYSLNVFLAVVYIIYKDHILKAFRPLQYLHFMSTWKFALDEWVFLNTCHIYLYFKTFERFISQKNNLISHSGIMKILSQTISLCQVWSNLSPVLNLAVSGYKSLTKIYLLLN